MNTPWSVVIADDQIVARGYMEMHIRSDPRFVLEASFPTAQEALDWCQTHHPDLLILDVMMRQGIDGLSAALQIHARHPDIRIILATSMAETSWVDQARQAGIHSFWFKESLDMPLPEIMAQTMQGASVYTTTPKGMPFGNISSDELSPKQLEVLRYLTGGLSNPEIAERMQVEPSTIRSHLERIMEKTGIRSRTELAVKASRLGLVISDEDRTAGLMSDPE